jgi:integrase
MKTPHFHSSLAPSLDGLFRLRQALGYNMRSMHMWLSHFDRFLVAQSWDEHYLTRDLVEAWVASGRPIAPRTRAERVHMMRLLARYISQTHPETFIPAPAWGLIRDPGFRPHIYSPAEVKILLAEATRLTPRGSLRPKTYVTLFGLLFSTGLRIAEALALNLADVDLDVAVLTVREGKFHKSRALPLHPTAVAPIEAYRRMRVEGFPGQSEPEAPFLVNEKGGRLHHSLVCATFLQIVRAVGIRSRPGVQGPRIHDIRHSFATARLLAWYKDGEDVQARLLLLSTYMGHVSIASTQVYLEATAELLMVAAARFRSPEFTDDSLCSGGPT